MINTWDVIKAQDRILTGIMITGIMIYEWPATFWFFAKIWGIVLFVPLCFFIYSLIKKKLSN